MQVWVWAFVWCSRAGPVLTSNIISRGCVDSDSALFLSFFLFSFFLASAGLAPSCFLLSSMWLCRGHCVSWEHLLSGSVESMSSWLWVTGYSKTKRGLPMLASGGRGLESFRVCSRASQVQQGVSPDDRVCLSVWYQQLALMSLHEFLREGGEVSYRIINRLSSLIQNLDISGPPFPFSPGSRKNSWRDWDGKTKKRRETVHVWLFLMLCATL